MKLLPEGKSKALSAGALAAAAVCAVMALKAARDTLTLIAVFTTPAYKLSMARATLPVEMPPLAWFIVRHALFFFVFSLLFWSSGLALALGAWARREWARRGGCAMLYLLSAASLLLLLYPWLAVPRPLEYGGVSLAPDFNATVNLVSRLVRFGAFAVGGLCLWGALALDRGQLKSEFH